VDWQQCPDRLETLMYAQPPFSLQGLLSLVVSVSLFVKVDYNKRINKWATGAEEREKVFSKSLGPMNYNHAIPLMRRQQQQQQQQKKFGTQLPMVVRHIWMTSTVLVVSVK
jgi:hypothetical protein